MQATRLLLQKNQKLLRLPFRRPVSSSRADLTQKEDAFETDSVCRDSGSSTADDSVKVTVVGAAGRVGRILSLLLKTCPLVDQLCLFDVDHSVKGVCVDISHIDTKCCVHHVRGMSNIREALDDPAVVLIAAGSPSSPQLNGERLFRKNAPIVAELSEACAKFCPEACLVLITNPINSLLPVAGEMYELITGGRPTEKLFGLTTLDVVRASTFVAEATRQDPSRVIVPVIGGTSEDTIVPVISQMKPCCKIKHEEVIALTECVRQAERSLTDCQNCGTRGSSSLSTAYVAFRFSYSLISALKGDGNVLECAYVQSDIIPELEYMASPLKLGRGGIEHNYGYPKLSEFEVKLMEEMAPILKSDIAVGKLYVCEGRGSVSRSPSCGQKARDADSACGVVELTDAEEAVSTMAEVCSPREVDTEKSGTSSRVLESSGVDVKGGTSPGCDHSTSGRILQPTRNRFQSRFALPEADRNRDLTKSVSLSLHPITAYSVCLAAMYAFALVYSIYMAL